MFKKEKDSITFSSSSILREMFFLILRRLCESLIFLVVILFLFWSFLILIIYQNKECSLIEIEKIELNNCSKEEIVFIDDRLRLNHLRILGTHNSYHLRNLFYNYSHQSLKDQLLFGIRQIELDIHFMKDHLVIYHLQILDHRTNCYCLKECLMKIVQWKKEKLCHYPISIFLEIKQRFYEDLFTGLKGTIQCKHFQQIQKEFLQIFDKNLFILPKEIQSNEMSLRNAFEKQRINELNKDYSQYNSSGWPTVKNSLNKILLIFLDDVHQIIPDLYFKCQSLRDFFFIGQSNLNLPYSSFITLSNSIEDQNKLLSPQINSFITRILFAYGDQFHIKDYFFIQKYGIHIISSDSLQCNQTFLCEQLNKQLSIQCNSYRSPTFCNSSSFHRL